MAVTTIALSVLASPVIVSSTQPEEYEAIASDLGQVQHGQSVLRAEYPIIYACIEDAPCRDDLPIEFKSFFIGEQSKYWRAALWYDWIDKSINDEQSIFLAKITLIEGKDGSFLFILPSAGILPVYEYIIVK